MRAAPARRMPPATVGVWRLRRSLPLWYRDVESVEGRRDQAIEANEVDQFVGTMLPEGLDRQTIKRLWQRPTPHKRIGEIKQDAFIGREIAWLEVRNQRRQPLRF